MSEPATDRLIVALDLPSTEEAREAIAAIGRAAAFYKIGYQLIPVGGLDLARDLSAAGKKVFLDFKFHDIGATVERGTASVAKLGADFLTVHAEPDVLKGAVAGRGGDKRLKVLGVTVLTSLTQESLAESGVSIRLEELVLKRAEICAKAGADGVVASAREAAAIRERFGKDLLIVTPGVRPQGANADDQARIVTPADAIRSGADYLVVGRPIVNSKDPGAAACAIVEEIAGASAGCA
ncbi:MAG: orotidine-5'-phosphate decarboxylase [Parvularculaceae bacterium]|nr:orotidine-5'-phosphate decarboxylase [Parvularculaceae bacterium]